MALTKLSASLGLLAATLGANALPSPSKYTYSVKETHWVPRAWTEAGSASKSDLINLQIGLKQQNEGLIEQHLTEVSDPSHERYGEHLSAEDIKSMITPSDDTLTLVNEWLQDHGISTIGMSPAKDWFSIVVPIEKAEELLQTSYKTFRHHDGSTVSRAPEWSLPNHLHEHIDVVQPTTSFFRPMPEGKGWGPYDKGPHHHMSWWEHTGKHMYGDRRHNWHDKDAAAVEAVCNASFVTPDCIRTVYGTIDYEPQVPEKNSMGLTNYLNETNKRSDTELFLKTFRPEAADAAYTFDIIEIANASNFQGNISVEIELNRNIEGNLDVQNMLSVAWPTPLTAFSTGGSPPFIPDINTPTNTNEPYLTWLNYVLSQDELPNVISTSYGEAEQTIPESYAKRVCAGMAQLGSRGISVLFSSGDAGVGADGTCYSNDGDNTYMFLPAFPASCPWVTAVGGTAGFNPEVAVSRFASGAGFSNLFGMPSYQQKTIEGYVDSLNGLHDGLYNKSGRAYPDVAAQGNHDAIVWGGEITTVGGTSASSPTFAAIITLVNDALIAKGRKPLGFLNPWIYSGAYKALTDITSGSSFGCNTTGFPAQEGWDAVTGFGTPNFDKLVRAAFAKGWDKGWN
ncbi:tripeptidyl-peptidase 1 precursor [Hortaea werneckii]|nr:tripeptidyl-peptidase 1 precursor [Hortaea werneckii]KAI7579797.1 tripeptidyl-peptidase 1 precursor [Hortaea werneckii]RMY17913.1 hypothetical protein D0867_05696 [Hortaea werneckii]RMY29980.1 hypothetical protein D0866_08319 [Hortaea werneckii]